MPWWRTSSPASECSEVRARAGLSLLLTGLVCFGPGGARGQVPAPDVDALVTAVEAAAPGALRRHDAPGVAVGMVYRGEVVWADGFGLADVERAEPMTGSTALEIASVTKPVTAWAVLRLAEQGLLDLDAPIETYLTRWSLPPSEFDHRGVTARTILAHAAGLSFGGDPGVEPGEPVPSIEEGLDGKGMEGGGTRVVSPPGEAFKYSSKGYLLLELAVEEITGEPFSDYTVREVLAPLGLGDSGFEWTEALSARGAVGYDWLNRPHPRYEHGTHAQGGLITSAQGLAHFLAASMTGPDGEPPGRGVITPEAVDATFTPFPYAADKARVGLGYNLVGSGETLVARKSGSHRGWKSAVFLAPRMGAALAILTNSDRAASGVFADIACPWSQAMAGDPLAGLCTQLTRFRDVQVVLAVVLAVLALVYGGRLYRAVGVGSRRWALPRTTGRLARQVLLALFLAGWWIFWYTDTFLSALGFAPTFVTVLLDPWPTAFVWVSWSVTLLALALIAGGFTARNTLAGQDTAGTPS